MVRTIEAIYENGMFRPLVSIELPEQSVIEIELHLPENGRNLRQKVNDVFRAAGLSRSLRFDLPDSSLTEKRRKELAEKFSAGKPLGDLIDEDRGTRG